jgi:hypothetical protein
VRVPDGGLALAAGGGRDREARGDRGALAGGGPDLEPAAERGEPVGHIPLARAHRGTRRVVLTWLTIMVPFRPYRADLLVRGSC